jgi:hypothetical protein
MPDAPQSKNGTALDKLLTGLDAMMKKVDDLTGRMDQIEARKAKPIVNDEDEDLNPLPPDNADGKALAEEGKPVPVAADGGLNAARVRRANLASAQARHDAVAGMFGEKALPALQGESVVAYRKRLTRPLQKFSPTWKGIDLDSLDKHTLNIAEADILRCAADEAAHPKVPVGHLMKRERDVGGHKHVEFFGSPRVWMDRFHRGTRYVEKINLRPMQGITSN